MNGRWPFLCHSRSWGRWGRPDAILGRTHDLSRSEQDRPLNQPDGRDGHDSSPSKSASSCEATPRAPPLVSARIVEHEPLAIPSFPNNHPTRWSHNKWYVCVIPLLYSWIPVYQTLHDISCIKCHALHLLIQFQFCKATRPRRWHADDSYYNPRASQHRR